MLLLKLFLVAASFTKSVKGTVPINTTSNVLHHWQEFFENYDKNIEPNSADGGPIGIKVEVFIRDIESIDDAAMKWSIHITLKLGWSDSRLQSIIRDFSNPITVPKSLSQKLWVPNLFFVDGWDTIAYNFLSKKTDFTEIQIQASQNGDIMLTAKTFLTLGCPLEFKSYPFDQQVCRMKITSNNAVVSWMNSDPVKLKENLKLTNFVFVKVRTNSCSSHDSYENANNTIEDKDTTTSSCLILECEFEREISFYQSTIYIPSVIVILVVWFSLFLDPLESAGARSVILASSTIVGNLFGGFLIKVPASYSTALGRWITVCQVFLLIAVLEFVSVNRLAVRQKHDEKSDTEQNLNNEQTEQVEESKLQLRKLTMERKWPFTIDVLFRVNFLLAFLVFNLRYYFTYVKRPDLGE